MARFLSTDWFKQKWSWLRGGRRTQRPLRWQYGKDHLPLMEILEDRLLLNASNETFGKLPMVFEPNQGQTDAQVQFLARGPGYGLFLTPSEAVMTLVPPTSTEGTGNAPGSAVVEPTSVSVVRMQFVNANPD